MKRIYFLMFIISPFFLVSCAPAKESSIEADEPSIESQIVEIMEEEKVEETIQDEEDYVSEELYYDDGRYLWRAGEKVMSEEIVDWLGGENYNASIRFQRDEGDKVYIYLSSGTDCGGCFVFEDDYMIIDKETNEITRGKLRMMDDMNKLYGLFERGNGAYKVSPDKTKVAYVKSLDMINDGEQAIYVYDLLTQKNELVEQLAAGQRAARMGPGGFYVFSDFYEEGSVNFYWDEDSGELIVE